MPWPSSPSRFSLFSTGETGFFRPPADRPAGDARHQRHRCHRQLFAPGASTPSAIWWRLLASCDDAHPRLQLSYRLRALPPWRCSSSGSATDQQGIPRHPHQDRTPQRVPQRAGPGIAVVQALGRKGGRREFARPTAPTATPISGRSSSRRRSTPRSRWQARVRCAGALVR